MEILTGEDIWRVQQPNRPLIEGVLWEGDVVMLLGSEKAGKSILGLQMAFCLTTSQPFLDKYTIPTPQPVLYIQTEGKESETVERMHAMANTIPVGQERFARLFQHFLTLDAPLTVQMLITAIQQMLQPPKVVIVDSLYTSMAGDLNENQAIRQFITQVSRLLQELGVTLIIIHHETKEQWEAGQLVERGDRASYGSVFLRAWVSHILYLKKHKDKSRTLTCDTQRSGRVLEREELILVEPNPLFFQRGSGHSPSAEQVFRALLQAEPLGLTRDQLVEHTALAMPTIEKALSQMYAADEVTKTNGRPVVYRVCSRDNQQTNVNESG